MTMVTDALWCVRSVMGGFVLFRGVMIKAWSRRILLAKR